MRRLLSKIKRSLERSRNLRLIDLKPGDEFVWVKMRGTPRLRVEAVRAPIYTYSNDPAALMELISNNIYTLRRLDAVIGPFEVSMDAKTPCVRIHKGPRPEDTK